MKYHLSIMSIDPDEDEDDNHQKYAREVEAASPVEAERIVKSEFAEEGLPVYCKDCYFKHKNSEGGSKSYAKKESTDEEY